MKAFRLCAAILAAAATTSAFGQPSKPASPKPGIEPVSRSTFIATMDAEFKRIDADKNNILSRKEIEDYERAVLVVQQQQRNARAFQLLDKDKNGVLSPGEFAALATRTPVPNAAPLLAQTDGNRDGSVTPVEYRTGKLVNFDRMDIDKDGMVSEAEMRRAGLIK